MRYFVFADVHANLEALKATLSVLKQEKVDQSLFLGDLVGYGAQPNETIELLKTINLHTAVCGNHDRVISSNTPVVDFQTLARYSILWTKQQITADNKRYLATFSDGLVKIEGSIGIVHCSPHRRDYYILNRRDAKKAFRKSQNWITLFAHTHIAVMHSIDDKVSTLYPENDFYYPLSKKKRYLINPGAVGQPRDLDSRASIAILDTDEKMIYWKRIEYDIRSAQDKIRKEGLPSWHADRLGIGH